MRGRGPSARIAGNPVVLLLALMLFINYVDRGAMPTAASYIQDDLHLSERQLGILLSAFFYTYALVQVPIGWLAERFGAHRVLACGLALWAVSTMLVGVVYSFATLLTLRLLLGIGESVGFPCSSKLLALTVPTSGLGTANGITAFAYLLGPAVGTYAGGLLIAHYGWRASFFIFGGASLLWLLPWARCAVPQHTHSANAPDNTPTLAMILRQRALWGTALGHFATNYTFYFMLSWLPFYLVRERGFSVTEMAQLAGMAYLVNALAAVVGGWTIDRYIARGGSTDVSYKLLMAVAQLGAIGCMLGMALGPRPIALGCIFLYQALCGAQSPAVFAIPQILAGASATGRWVGVQNSLGNLAGILAPLLTGFIVQATRQFTAAFLLAAAVSVLGFVGWVLMIPRLQPLQWPATSATVG